MCIRDSLHAQTQFAVLGTAIGTKLVCPNDSPTGDCLCPNGSARTLRPVHRGLGIRVQNPPNSGAREAGPSSQCKLRNCTWAVEEAH
eukprot:1159612-Alexandrium_andersonii.AAC.1